MAQFAALFAAFSLAAGVPSQTLLRFQPPVGKAIRYEATVAMNASGGAAPKPMSFTEHVPFTMRIVSRKGSTTQIESRIGGVRVDVPAGSPMAAGKAQIEKAMTGRVGTMSVDAMGNIQNSLTAAAMSATGGLGKGAQGVAFPAKAVQVGDTWGGAVDLGRLSGSMMGGNAKLSGRIPIVYRLTRLANGVATIAMTVNGKADLGGAQPMKMAIRYTGTFDVDAKTGLLRSMKATSDNDVTLPGKGTMKQRIVVTTRAL